LTLVLFDVDGTLVDAGGAGREALCRAFEKVFGQCGLGRSSAAVPFDGRTDSWIIEEIAGSAGIDPTRLASEKSALEESYLVLLEEILSAGRPARALPGVASLLPALAGRGHKLGLVTGNIRRGARVKLSAAGITGYFDEGAYGDDSPDRSVLARLARERFEARMGEAIAPGSVLLVGDSRQDVRAARANGYRSLAVATGWTRREDLGAEGADRVMEDLSATEEVLSWISGAP